MICVNTYSLVKRVCVGHSSYIISTTSCVHSRNASPDASWDFHVCEIPEQHISPRHFVHTMVVSSVSSQVPSLPSFSFFPLKIIFRLCFDFKKKQRFHFVTGAQDSIFRTSHCDSETLLMVCRSTSEISLWVRVNRLFSWLLDTPDRGISLKSFDYFKRIQYTHHNKSILLFITILISNNHTPYSGNDDW